MPYRKIKKPPRWQGHESSLVLDHFGRLDIRVGIIKDIVDHPRLTYKHYLVAVNFGGTFSLVITIGVSNVIPPEDLINKMVVACLNIKPMWLKYTDMYACILGTKISDNPDGVELLIPPLEAVPGDIITVSGYEERDPDTPFVDPAKPIFERINYHNKVDMRKRVLYKNSPWMIEEKPGSVHTKQIRNSFGSRLVEYYEADELEDRMVVLLCNVEYGMSHGFDSMASLMCAKLNNKIELLDPPPNARIGDKVFVPGYGRGTINIVAPGDYRNDLRPFLDPEDIKVFDDAVIDLKVNSHNQAEYRGIPLQIEGKEGFITTYTLKNCPITGVDCDVELY